MLPQLRAADTKPEPQFVPEVPCSAVKPTGVLRQSSIPESRIAQKLPIYKTSHCAKSENFVFAFQVFPSRATPRPIHHATTAYGQTILQLVGHVWPSGDAVAPLRKMPWIFYRPSIVSSWSSIENIETFCKGPLRAHGTLNERIAACCASVCKASVSPRRSTLIYKTIEQSFAPKLRLQWSSEFKRPFFTRIMLGAVNGERW